MGIGLLSDVFDDLGKPIDARRLVEVPGAIEHGQLNTGNFREARFALHAAEPFGLVDRRNSASASSRVKCARPRTS